MADNTQNTNNNATRSMKGSAAPGQVRHVSAKEKRSMKEIKATLNKLFVYIGSHKIVLIIGLILAALSSILMLMGPNLVGSMTDVITNGLEGEIDIAAINGIGMTLVVIYVSSAVFTFVQQYIMAGMTAKICKKLRREFSEKLNRVPQSYYNTHILGDILSCVTNDVQTIRQGLSRSVPTIIRSLAQFLTCVLMMLITQ